MSRIMAFSTSPPDAQRHYNKRPWRGCPLPPTSSSSTRLNGAAPARRHMRTSSQNWSSSNLPVEERIEHLGFKPPKRDQTNRYDYAKVAGDVVYCYGNGTHGDAGPSHVSRVGTNVTPEEAPLPARQCAQNCLASIRAAVGELDQISQVIKVLGFVSCSAAFFDSPAVLVGCTDFLLEVFGVSGRRGEPTIGTSNLPGNTPVEIELTATSQNSLDPLMQGLYSVEIVACHLSFSPKAKVAP